MTKKVKIEADMEGKKNPVFFISDQTIKTLNLVQ